MLKLTGFWQTKNSTWAYFAYGIIMHIIFIDVFLVLQIGYLFKFQTLVDFASLMTMLPTYTAMFLRSVYLFYNFDQIVELFEVLHKSLDHVKMTPKFTRHLTRIQSIFKFFWSSAAISCIVGSFVPFTAHELPYRMWFPYDYVNSFYMFWCGSFYQIISTLCCCGFDIVEDTLPVFFMAYILAMLEQLCDQLKDLKKTESKREMVLRRSEFLKCIDFQMSIIELTKKVEKIFSLVFLIRGLISTFILCTTSFALTAVSMNQNKSKMFRDLKAFSQIRFHQMTIRRCL